MARRAAPKPSAVAPLAIDPTFVINTIQSKVKGVNVRTFASLHAADCNPVVGWVETGCWAVDWLFGDFRGIPLGKLTLIWGSESTGKSALALFIVKSFQRQNAITTWMGYDQAFDPDYVRNAGLNEQTLLLPDVSTMEEGIDVINNTVTSLYAQKSKGKKRKDGEEVEAAPDGKNSPPYLNVWDSVASSPPQESIEKTAGDPASIAAVAKVFSNQLPTLRQRIKRCPAHLLFINEARDMFGGQSFGPTERPARGGRALRHNATTVIRTQVFKQLKKEKAGRKVSTGCIVIMSAGKARFGVRNRQAEFLLSYSKKSGGLKVVQSNYMFLESNNLIMPAGKDGVKIRHMDLPPFKPSEWPEVHKQHKRAIKKMLVEHLSAKSPMDNELNGDTHE